MFQTIPNGTCSPVTLRVMNFVVLAFHTRTKYLLKRSNTCGILFNLDLVVRNSRNSLVTQNLTEISHSEEANNSLHRTCLITLLSRCCLNFTPFCVNSLNRRCTSERDLVPRSLYSCSCDMDWWMWKQANYKQVTVFWHAK